MQQQSRSEVCEQAYCEHHSTIYRTCVSILHDAELAEDVVQEAYIRLSEHFREVSRNVRGWLRVCAKRLALNTLQSERARSRREARWARDEDRRLQRHADARELQEVVREAVDELPLEDRELVLSYYVQGRSQQSIGYDLGVSHVIIGRRLRRARERLARILQRQGVGLGPGLVLSLIDGHKLIDRPLD